MDEALTTGLISFFEKRRFRNFLSYLSKYEEEDPKTYQGKEGFPIDPLSINYILLT